ncbi:adenylyl cyclase X E [Culicoides brevitarsis]|uniref:adenylyl cyclase X E n=1 Tax=Culicoides brevitarsis TaxID=469753 RepID=UPI00307C6C5A
MDYTEDYAVEFDTCDTTSLKSNPHFNLGKWEISFLKKECQNLGLENIYQTYIQRVQRSFLSIFFVLQTIINLIHVIIISTNSRHSSDLFPDIICYTVPLLVVWISLFATFKEDFVKKYPYVPFVASCIALFSLIIADLTIPIYHAMHTFVNPPLRVAYASHLLFVIYMFLPLKDNWLTVILGTAATGSYIIVFIYVTYDISEQTTPLTKVITESIFLVAVNFFGIYHRLMNEIAIRSTFLDRRECVVGNLLLKFARNQENDLLLSILPDHTAQALEKDIAELLLKIRAEKQKNRIPQQVHIGKQWRGHAINKLYVEEHKDVSILYADVVNYTMMTTQLPVRTLVETLHELFVKFDDASKEFNVLRIKFLGDCYYCVAGVPVRNKRHAKSCVDLGLRMIRDIRDVRLSRNLDIDMRIGVHSGSIISGVIGSCKWQYDIWSRDVNIANKMESTGCPGKVHVTAQTLELLEGEYMYEDGTEAAKKDPTLKQYNIQTYLIGPHYYMDNIFYSQDDTSGLRLSSGVKRKVGSRNMDGSRSNFMKSSMERYRDIMKQADIEMARELDRMPIGKFNLNKVFTTKSREPRRTPEDEDRDSISTLCLCLSPKSREISFLSEPDNVLKYSTLMVFFVFVVIFIIQNMNKPFSTIYWTIISVSGIILASILPITWFNRLWDITNPDVDVSMPKNPFANRLYRFSDKLTRNALARHCIYLVSVLILVIVSFIHLVDCSSDKVVYPTVEPIPTVYTGFISRAGIIGDISTKWCLNPWSVTECLILTIGVTFMFQKIHFILKLTIALMILSFYSWIVFGALHTMFSNSASVNPTLSPNVAHFLAILFTTVIFHLIDRNSEYIAKVDYNWKQQLLRKQQEAELTKETNKILVHNILPAHVAEIYINQQSLAYEFYNEEYENVAVLFATITNFDVTSDVQNEKGILNVLNEIICDFDDVLLSYRGPQKIEKIKVAGWTYMAACGLDPGRGDASVAYPHSLIGHNSSLGRSSHLSSTGRRSFKPIFPAPKQNQRKSQNVVMVLTEFALDLMRNFQKFNVENFKDTSPGLLRIGISHGKVMAGVVGSSKPLYDIWGNSVNMASRMDSTGVPGKIQVTKETANVLQQYGVQCDYRGDIFVKGRGEIPTFFVRIDEELNFVRRNPNSFRPAFETKL